MVMQPPAGANLEAHISGVGSALSRTLAAVIDGVPGAPHGPSALARQLDLDKVLTSRLLKAVRNKDALAVVTLTPGPVPLRRLLAAARTAGVDVATIAEAEIAVDQFETLIRSEAGGRRSLDSMISAWLPDARQEFELRAKKAAFVAMSQLKGVCADTHLLTFMLHPSGDGAHVDYVWLFGLLGLQRLREGAAVHFASTRISHEEPDARDVRTLDGAPLGDLEPGLVEAFCSTPTPALDVSRAGNTVHYALAHAGFGPKSAVDLVCAHRTPKGRRSFDPPGRDRLTSYYAQIRTPVARLQFDMLVHEDVYPDIAPELLVYDTCVEGTADVNDPAREVDRFTLLERIDDLGTGIQTFRSGEVPQYAPLLREVCDATGWDGSRFRGYRCSITCPVYGSQVAMTFDVPTG